ncbi:MAG: terminase large subunit [Phycisphaerae bacterium]|nr:MAG: terminase large subunit [Phycisphaerae bacterium]
MQHTLDLPIPNNAAANAPIEFIQSLQHHTENIAVDYGEQIKLVEYQDQLIRTFFGTLNDDGLRRFRSLFLFIAGKNGKSATSALILVYYLVCVKQNQSIISIASSREQASVIFNEAYGLLRQAGYIDDSGNKGTNSDPKKFIRVSTHNKILTNTKNGNVYKVKTSQPKTIDGEIIDVVACDELHRLDHAAEIWAIITKGLANKKEPILLCTTTAGHGENSFCYQKYKEAKQIIAGDLDAPTVLPFVYEVPVEDDIYDENNWIKANPALGGDKPFLDINVLRTAAESARRNPIDEQMFRRFHMNQFADAEVSWIQPAQWDKCQGEFTEQELLGEIAYGGIDYAPVNDLSAFVLCVPKDNKYYLICRAWLPDADIQQKCDRDGVDYLKWVRSGHLKLTAGDTTDLETITADILDLAGKYQVQAIAADPHNTVALIQTLNANNITTFGHGMTHAMMNYPCQQTMRAVMEQRLVHDGNPLLRTCAINTVVHMDHGQRIKPDKKAAKGKKTDAMVATILALGRAATVADQGLDPKTYFDQQMVWV